MILSSLLPFKEVSRWQGGSICNLVLKLKESFRMRLWIMPIISWMTYEIVVSTHYWYNRLRILIEWRRSMSHFLRMRKYKVVVALRLRAVSFSQIRQLKINSRKMFCLLKGPKQGIWQAQQWTTFRRIMYNFRNTWGDFPIRHMMATLLIILIWNPYTMSVWRTKDKLYN